MEGWGGGGGGGAVTGSNGIVGKWMDEWIGELVDE